MENAGLSSVVLEANLYQIENVLKDYAENNAFDAVIALDTDASFAVYKVASELGKNIPSDIAVIGYMSERIAPYLTPELTTINQHSYTMGETAAKMLLAQLESKQNTDQTILIDSTLSQRISS